MVITNSSRMMACWVASGSAVQPAATLYSGFDGGPWLFVNGVSAAQLGRAPAGLHTNSLGHVYLSTPLAGRCPPTVKHDHVVVLGRIMQGTGQHIAARLAHRLRG